MCGIIGILKPSPNLQIQRRAVKEMCGSIAHRGPDGWGIYLSPSLSLGHVRLSIFDLASGDQPMASERYVLAYNGEVYNHIELRSELEKKGYIFKTVCDTEVILHAYHCWGADAVKRFNGQFAFLLWDKKLKKLTVVRDRFGIRPLYVLRYKSSFFFSSELKAFDRIDGYRREMDSGNLFEHALMWNTLNDRTVFKDIRSVRAGTFEVYTEDSLDSVHSYYEIGETLTAGPSSFGEAKEDFRQMLDDSVRLRLRSDVPVGNYLSGGIDSSVITSLTAKHQKQQFKTFSIAFEDGDFDESAYQQAMVDSIGSDHHLVKVSYKMINETFKNAVYHTERPIFRTAPVPLYLLSQMVREQGIKVVLTGEAADEILWGYDSFKELRFLDIWNRRRDSKFRPQLIKQLYPHLKHYNDPKYFGLIKMFYEGFLNLYDNDLVGLNIRCHNNKILKNYFNPDLKVSFNQEKMFHSLGEILPPSYKSWNLLQKNQFMEMRTLLQGYLLSSQGDRMSMAHSVEGRYPFLDHRLVDKLFYYKDRFKLKGFSQKHLLRQAFKEDIPSSIINRPKLPYMAPDLKSFFSGGKLTEEAEFFLSTDRIKEYGLFNHKLVERFIRKFEKGIPDKIGYRDNMLIVFLLSSQIVCYNINHTKSFLLDEDLKTVEIIDF